MDLAIQILLCFAGFFALCYGAGFLVRGSSSLARSLGVTPMVVGLTVVAFGTSAPELVVSLVSSVQGKGMLAVGNAVGSNICNIALVLGLAAVFRPLVCGRSVVTRDIPVMLGASAFVILLLTDSYLGLVEGIVLLVGIVLYTLYNYASMKQEVSECGAGSALLGEAEKIPHVESRGGQILMILVGIAGVVGGAELVVGAATELMHYLEVDEKFIGLTMVAFGTSLPELVTSVVAGLRKETDIGIGNLVGSNVFNILSVIGVAAVGGAVVDSPIVIYPSFFEGGLAVDFTVMIVVSALPWFMMRRDQTVGRIDGLILLGTYFGYLAYLISRT